MARIPKNHPNIPEDPDPFRMPKEETGSLSSPGRDTWHNRVMPVAPIADPKVSKFAVPTHLSGPPPLTPAKESPTLSDKEDLAFALNTAKLEVIQSDIWNKVQEQRIARVMVWMAFILFMVAVGMTDRYNSTMVQRSCLYKGHSPVSCGIP